MPQNILVTSCLMICFLPAAINAQPGEKPLTKPASLLNTASLPTTKRPTAKGAADIDLSSLISFRLMLGADQKSLIQFDGKQNLSAKVDASKIGDLIGQEFASDNQLTGIMIRVDGNVKYPVVSSLYEKINKTLTEQEIQIPVYIAVQDPRVPPKKDEIITREFVIRNVPAADIYERVAKVARLLKYEVRLDPARNSFVVKGSSAKMAGVQNLITALDLKPGTPKPGTPKPERPPIVLTESDAPGQTEQPPKIQMPLKPDPVAKQASDNLPPAVGRYQVSVSSNSAILVDTVTGETWFLDGNAQSPMFWSKIPMPPER